MTFYNYPTVSNGILQTPEELENTVNGIYIAHPEYFTIRSNNVELANESAFAAALGMTLNSNYFKWGTTYYWGVPFNPAASTDKTAGLLTTTWLDVPVYDCFNASGNSTIVGDYSKCALIYGYKRSGTYRKTDAIMHIKAAPSSTDATTLHIKAVGPYTRNHQYSPNLRSPETIKLADGKPLNSCYFYCVYDTTYTAPPSSMTDVRPSVGFGASFGYEFEQLVVAVTQTFTLYRATSHTGSTKYTPSSSDEYNAYLDQGYLISTSPSFPTNYYNAGKVGNWSTWNIRADEVMVNGVKLSPTAKYDKAFDGDSTWAFS